MVTVPMLKDNEAIGVITIFRTGGTANSPTSRSLS